MKSVHNFQPQELKFDTCNANILYLTTEDGGVYRTMNALIGYADHVPLSEQIVQWEFISSELIQDDVQRIVIEHNYNIASLYVGTDGGSVFRCDFSSEQYL